MGIACRRCDKDAQGQRERVHLGAGDREAGRGLRLLLGRRARRADRLRGAQAVSRGAHLDHQRDHPQPHGQQGIILFIQPISGCLTYPCAARGDKCFCSWMTFQKNLILLCMRGLITHYLIIRTHVNDKSVHTEQSPLGSFVL